MTNNIISDVIDKNPLYDKKVIIKTKITPIIFIPKTFKYGL